MTQNLFAFYLFFLSARNLEPKFDNIFCLAANVQNRQFRQSRNYALMSKICFPGERVHAVYSNNNSEFMSMRIFPKAENIPRLISIFIIFVAARVTAREKSRKGLKLLEWKGEGV